MGEKSNTKNYLIAAVIIVLILAVAILGFYRDSVTVVNQNMDTVTDNVIIVGVNQSEKAASSNYLIAAVIIVLILAVAILGYYRDIIFGLKTDNVEVTLTTGRNGSKKEESKTGK